jgi:tape measure domain-containing protein
MAMNMDAVLRIVAKVDGGNALQKLGADLAGIGNKASSTVSPLGQMSGAMRGVADVAATIGLAKVGRDLLQAGIQAEASSVRINALAKGYGEVQDVTGVAARAAEQFALGNVEAQNAVTDLYGRLRPMGVSLKDIETVFFGVNKAAKQVGLSTYDTSEVLLQLSQALGSGRLQGDELVSIMERMPVVGQAVAKVMGVSASEIKKLGSEGKITTEVMIRAAAELNKIVPPPPTSMQEFDKALKDLRTELGENLLPILTPFVQGMTTLVKAFAGLPEPIQTAAIALVAFAVAAGPVASVITGIGQAMMIIGSLSIGATIAGWLGALAPALAGITAALGGLLTWIGATFIPALLAFFSGPVGWTVLAVAAVVAMAIAFREPLMQFAAWLWDWTEFARAPFVRL